MKPEQVDILKLDESFLADRLLQQALIYCWDQIEVAHQNPIAPNQIDLDQLVEGFWFGERSFLHLYRTENQLQAVYWEETGEEESIDEPLLIDHRRRKEW